MNNRNKIVKIYTHNIRRINKMRFELVIMLIAGFLMANIYTEGKYMNMLVSWKKYYQMAGVAFAALMFYILIKKNPLRAREIVSTSNDYIKYLPIDKNTTSMVAPLIDFTGKALGDSINSNYNANHAQNQYNQTFQSLTPQQRRLLNSGNKGTKRSVSETKKKYVAANQNWKCKHCTKQLPAWFEVDHVMKLEYGGSNNIDNLEALCRDCHGKKTAMENL